MASTQVGSIHYDLDLNTKKFDEAALNISKKFQSIGDNLTRMGQELTLKVTAPIIGTLGLATKAAIDYESAFAGVRKTVSASEADFKAISDNLREIAKRSPVSATELARIAEMAGQLGISGVENITKFTEVITKFTSATGIASEEAAINFARIANVMQEPISNVDRMGSVVAQLGDSAAATEIEILAFAERIAGAGKIAGVTTRDVFAIGSAMASVGIEAEAGGTAVQKVLISMTQAAKGTGENLEQFAKVAGMSSQEFKKAFEVDAGQAFNAFVTGLGKEGDRAFQVLDDLDLKDQRLMRAFLSLANAGDLLTEQIGIANKEWEVNNRLNEEAEKRYATTASQLQMAKNNLSDLGITIGSVLLPALNDLLKAITPIIQGFAKFAEAHPGIIKVLTAIALVVAALGPLLMAVGSVIHLFGTLSALGPIVTAVIQGIGVALAFLAANPIVLIIGAIVLLVALVVMNWDKIKQATIDMVERIKMSFEWWKNAFQVVGNFIGNMVNSISNFFNNLRNNISNSVNNIGNSVKDRFWDMVNFLSGLGGRIWSAITSPFESAWNKVRDIANRIRQEMDKINPFHRESPSLVDNIIKGVGVIEQEYSKLSGLNFESANSIFGMSDDVFGSAKLMKQEINVNVDKMGDKLDLNAVGRELGFRASLMPEL